MTTKKPLVGTVAGVRVRVYLGEDGRPSSAGARIDRPGDLDHERVVTLAATMAFDAALAAAQRVQRKGRSADAATESAKKRAKASVEHWANKYLARAHREHPDFGKARLAQAARRLAAKNKKIPLGKRDEITVDRAQQFLDRLVPSRR